MGQAGNPTHIHALSLPVSSGADQVVYFYLFSNLIPCEKAIFHRRGFGLIQRYFVCTKTGHLADPDQLILRKLMLYCIWILSISMPGSQAKKNNNNACN